MTFSYTFCKSVAALATMISFSLFADTAYVTNYQSNTVSAIDTTTNTVIATIPVGNQPNFMAVTPDQQFLYVTCSDGTVSVINAITNQVMTSITVGIGARYPQISNDGTNVYLSNTQVANIKTATNTATTVPGSSFCQYLAITPNGKFVYVANINDNTVSVIDTSTNTIIATIPVGTTPQFITINSAGTKAYVTNSFSNDVSIINIPANTISNTVAVGNSPKFITILPDDSKAYVTNYLDNTVSVINTLSETVINTVTTGAQPQFLLTNPSGSKVYVLNAADSTLSSINTSTDTVEATLNVGSSPLFLNFTPSGALAYVTNLGSDEVTVIDVATNTVLVTLTGFHTPYYVLVVGPYVPPPPPNPPLVEVIGKSKQNVFLNEKEFYNVIVWGAPVGIVPVEYLIYRDAALTDLAGTVLASQNRLFRDQNRKKGVTYTYYIVSVQADGTHYVIGSVAVKTK